MLKLNKLFLIAIQLSFASLVFLGPMCVVASAKNPKYWVDLTSDVDLDGCEISVVYVAAHSPDEPGRRTLTCRVERAITTEPGIVAGFKAGENSLWYRREGRQGPEIHDGDHILIFVPRAKGLPPVRFVFKLGADPDDSLDLQALTRIFFLRAHPGPVELIDAALSDNPTLARYALKRLLRQPPAAPPPLSVERLRLHRERTGAPADVRILASGLAARLEGKSEFGPEEYEWVKAVIVRGQSTGINQPVEFVKTLASFPSRRGETVDFLMDLIKKNPVEDWARLPAVNQLSNPHLFLYAKPDDAISQSIFNVYLSELRNPSARWRASASARLRNICGDIVDREERARARARVIEALRAAVAVETDPIRGAQIKRNVEALEKR